VAKPLGGEHHLVAAARSGPTDESEAETTVHRALEFVIDFLDTADMYGPLTNERLVGGTVELAHPHAAELHLRYSDPVARSSEVSLLHHSLPATSPAATRRV
jgi:predicted oxidoreductase